MPCHGGAFPDEDLAYAKLEIDKLTRLLCSATKLMLSCNLELSPEHREWWKRHDDIDKRRREQALNRIAELRKEISRLTAEIDS